MRSLRFRGNLSVVIIAFLALLPVTANAQMNSLPDFTPLVEANGPAVVNISTTQKMKAQHPPLPPGMQIPDLPEDSPFGDLFKHFFGDGEDGSPEEFDAQSLGSGFIISSDGYILTNFHVIKGADEIIVRLSDRRELVAKVVGSDERSDLAVLKIPADNLPIVKIGKSKDLKVGQWVLAIGSPFGFDHSATAGIVSALGRNLPSENYVPFIQTDVPINPGNSGGPLIDAAGRVIGINSQIEAGGQGGGNVGIGFAVPIDTASEIAQQLIDNGAVEHAFLGISGTDVTPEIADVLNLDDNSGALVQSVVSGSPADEAGISAGDAQVTIDGQQLHAGGDIITAVDGSAVSGMDDVIAAVDAKKPGDSIELTLLHGGDTRNVTVDLADRPAQANNG